MICPFCGCAEGFIVPYEENVACVLCPVCGNLLMDTEIVEDLVDVVLADLSVVDWYEPVYVPPVMAYYAATNPSMN